MGLPRAQVGELFGRSERMVRLSIVAFIRGIHGLPSKPRPGRPRKSKFERVRDCENWLVRYQQQYAPTVVNNSIGTLRAGPNQTWQQNCRSPVSISAEAASRKSKRSHYARRVAKLFRAD